MSKKNSHLMSIAGVLTAVAFAFTACSDASTAATEHDSINEKNRELAEAGREVVPAPSGVVVENISHGGVSTTEKLSPEHNRIITPAGTLFIDSVEVVDFVSIDEVDMDTSAGQMVDVEDAPTHVRAAEGEVFRVMEFRFIPQVMHGDVEQRSAVLDVRGAGQQHIMELETERTERILVSVPDNAEAQFVVSSEGHEQYIDVLSGERVADELNPAEAFYRDISEQDINHAYQLEDDAVQVQRISGSSNPVEDAVVEYDLRARTVSLTGWTPQEGWAPEGSAWLIMDWDYNFSTDFLNGLGASLHETALTMSAELSDGSTVEDQVINEQWSDGAPRSVLEVPLATTDFALSFDGTTEFSLDDINYEVISGQETVFDIATDTYAVELPASPLLTENTSEEDK